MRLAGIAAIGALLLPLAATAQSHPDWSTLVAAHVKVPAYITKAMSDPARVSHDKNNVMQDDAVRQMAAVLAFSGVKPGDTVLELAPGTGYWTSVFSLIVGPKGHVYQMWPKEWTKFNSKDLDQWRTLAKTAHYANVSPMQEPLTRVTSPRKVDIVFTDDNYHDFHDPFSGHVDIHRLDKQVYDALKPGGVFVIVDHIAPAASGISDTNTLHRIDPAVVKREVESAGFVFDGSSDALLNPKDPLTIKIFDPAVRGHTSQFIYRFKKPVK
ncbi:MAG: class I SAM-dependent methyltransferase [Rhodanobacteraceae bacterium]